MGRVYTFPWDFTGFLLGFIRKRREKTIGMIMTIGVATPEGNQGNERTRVLAAATSEWPR